MTDSEFRLRIAKYIYDNGEPTVGQGYAFVDLTPIRRLSGLTENEFHQTHLLFMKNKGILEVQEGNPNRARITPLGCELILDDEIQSHLDNAPFIQEGYDLAEVCLNGHVTTMKAASFPQFRKPHCPECGKPTITECLECQTPIQGNYRTRRGFQPTGKFAPAYCHHCGRPFPWTRSALDAAKELAYTLGLSEIDADSLAGTIDDLVSEGPRTTVAVQRFKVLLGKAGAQTLDLFQKVLASVITETVKHQLFGP